MEHHEDAAGPGSGHPLRRAFAAMVHALAADDPRFVRRVTRPAPGGLATANIAIMAGLVATVLLGVVPLTVGLHTGVLAMLVVGAVGCVVLPVAAPLTVRPLVRYRWPSAM